jgi:hypothetical protein
MVYRSFDDSMVFYLMGGMSIPDKVNAPESVQLKDMSGLIPPWAPIEQKGATQDGVTFVDALYDPIDADMTVEVIGKTPERTAQVLRDWIAAWDAKKPGELSFFDQYAGRWWASVRWTRNPVDKLLGRKFTRQQFNWPFKSADAFWRSYDNTDTFVFTYEDFVEDFAGDNPTDLGANWPLRYGGTGSGFLRIVDGEASWKDDEDSIFFTGTRRVVNGPFVGYNTPTNAQAVYTLIGTTPEFTVGAGAANDIWLRMGRNPDGTWNGNGVRGRIGWGYTQISVFNNFVETELERNFELWPPIRGERFVFDVEEGSRRFALRRRNRLGVFTVIATTDTDNLSMMDANHRGVGFGMQAGAAVLTQATPGEIGSVYTEDANGNIFELDAFKTEYPTSLGPLWPQFYTGDGTPSDAYCRSRGGEATWIENSGTRTQDVVAGPYREGGVTAETTTDNQVVVMEYGSFQEWSLPRGAANDLWARMGRNPDGTWNGYGIRLRMENNICKLSYFIDFDQTEMTSKVIVIPPLPGEKWKLVAGYQGNPRMFRFFRGEGKSWTKILDHKEVGTGSAIGAAYRGLGFGMQAGAALITQATPARIRRVTGGDHNEVTQSGKLTRINMGDQDMWDRYTLYGPGTFNIAAGPELEDMVSYGPLLSGQVVQLRADPRKRSVVDLTSVPSSPQELAIWQEARNDYLSFAGGNNTTPLEQASESVLGVKPPQGNMYSLLKGRFAQPVPAMPTAAAPRTYSVKVEIVGGDADSRIIAAGTPLRRWPL